MLTPSGTFRNAMIAAARWLSATKLRSSFSYRTSSFRKRLNQLWQALAVLVVSGVLAGFAPARRAVSITPMAALRSD